MITAYYLDFRPAFKPVDDRGDQEWYAAFNGAVMTQRKFQVIGLGICCFSIEESQINTARQYMESLGWELKKKRGLFYGYEERDFYIGQTIYDHGEAKELVEFTRYAQYDEAARLRWRPTTRHKWRESILPIRSRGLGKHYVDKRPHLYTVNILEPPAQANLLRAPVEVL